MKHFSVRHPPMLITVSETQETVWLNLEGKGVSYAVYIIHIFGQVFQVNMTEAVDLWLKGARELIYSSKGKSRYGNGNVS